MAKRPFSSQRWYWWCRIWFQFTQVGLSTGQACPTLLGSSLNNMRLCLTLQYSLFMVMCESRIFHFYIYISCIIVLQSSQAFLVFVLFLSCFMNFLYHEFKMDVNKQKCYFCFSLLLLLLMAGQPTLLKSLVKWLL